MTTNSYYTARATEVFSGRNRIINGACTVQQRAALANISANAYGPVDRFQALNTGSGGTVSQNASSMTINGATQASVVTFVGSTIPTTFTGTSYYGGIFQSIEGYNCADLVGQPVTVSFWFQATVTGSYSFSLSDYTNTHTYVTTFNVTTANTSQYVVINVPTLPTSLTVPNSNAGGLNVAIGVLATGSRGTATLNTWQAGGYLAASTATNWATAPGNDIAVSLLQLEVGNVATPFERRDYGDVLRQCQRYYETGGANYLGYASTGAGQYVGGTNKFAVNKRSGPTIALTRSTTTNVQSTTTTNGIGQDSFFSVTYSAAAGAYQVTDSWTASAEL
jgi:hypothetical protein